MNKNTELKIRDIYKEEVLKVSPSILTLEITHPTKKLHSLKELDDKDYRQYFIHLKLLSVNNNLLNTMVLTDFSFLSRIEANHNQLSTVSLRLPKLEKLDLSHNMLNALPPLDELPNLTELRVNENHIKKISYKSIKCVKETLIVLEMNSNKVDFSQPKEFFDFAKMMGENMLKLKAFSIDNNPFTSSQIYGGNYKNVFLFYCKSLHSFNGMTIEEKDSKLYANISNAKTLILDNFEKYNQDKEIITTEDEKKNSAITLKEIIFEMEKYQTIVRQKQVNLRELQIKIERYIEESEAKVEKDKEKIENDKNLYNKFLEKCNNIIETNPKLESSLFYIVGNFSLIKGGLFSQQSLQFFKHHLFFNSIEKSQKILAVINETILRKLKEVTKDEDIPPELISGLQEFASEPLFKSLTKDLSMKLRAIVIANANIKALNLKKEDNKKWEIFCAAINYLAQLTKDNEIISLMLEEEKFMRSLSVHIEEFLNYEEKILLSKRQLSEILINILNIICDLMTYSKENKTQSEIKKFDLNIMNELLDLKEKIIEKILDTKLQSYQRSLSDSGRDDLSVEQRYLKKIIFGCLIRTYGALLSKTEDPMKIMAITIPSSIPSALLTIFTHTNFFDPVIMSAICDCFGFIFKNEIVLSNKGNEFSFISNGLHSLRNALSFLTQGSQYLNSCTIAAAIGQNAMSNGQVIDIENMTSEVMIKMFVSVIDLMTFYAREAHSKVNTPIKDICMKVCLNLNDAGRVKILTHCLRSQSDEIKKAVVNCLFYVDSSQYEKEDLRNIYSQINVTNLANGDIEIVISTIFIILAKAFQKFLNDPKGEDKEKLQYNKDVFSIAYSILSKNSERANLADDSSSILKETLNISLVIFLINSSCYYQIKRYLCEKDNIEKVSSILYNEEKNLNEKFTLPIEIEKTRPGWSLSTLNKAINGTFCLFPYSYIFLRVMIHIADLMMNVGYFAYDIDDYDAFGVVVAKLKSEIIHREEERVQNEMKTFKDFISEKRSKGLFNIEENVNLISQLETEKKDQQNNFIYMLPSFMLFIYGRTINSQKTEFDSIWEDKQDPHFSKLNELLNEQNIVSPLTQEYTLTNNSDNAQNIYANFCRCLREEPIKNYKSSQDANYGYSHIRLDRIKFNRYGTNRDEFRRVKDEETANNPYLRGLVISAFLRAIFGVLEYPVDKETKEKMIQTLRKGNTIKELSMLVDSVKCQFNIASKYLIVMRHVFSETANGRSKVGDESELLSQLNIVSFMIKKMVRFKQEDINIANEDDKVFLSELSKCASVLTNETYSLTYPSDLHRERTMTYIVNYNLVKMFIDTVIQYMNSEMETLKLGMKSSEFATNDNESLNEMIFKIAYILGEYMSKCKLFSYKILESFSRSYIFNGVNMRKTYLREIIHTSKMSDMKNELEKMLTSGNNVVKINLISRCVFVNYVELSDYVRYVMLTEGGVELLQGRLSHGVLEKNEWEVNLAEQKIDEYVKYKYEDIIKIYRLELKNRIVIKTKNGFFGLFFMKCHVADEFIEILRNKNPMIPTPQILNLSAKKDEKRDYLLCYYDKPEGFFDVIVNFSKKMDYLQKLRVIKLTEDMITIYQEDYQKFVTKNIEQIITASQSNEHAMNSEICSFYTQEGRNFHLNDLKKVTFSKTDCITLNFGKEIVFKMFDDYSYLKLRKSILNALIKKGAQSNILERKQDLIIEGNIYSDIK